ncbi:YqjK family protein [Tepidimonas charontis]|uniref:YqjK family protein n=1 Tax=Tepidimonas charontis TaxID=2267262 RepID=UPI0013756838|nr:YqjK family protein [Tepidimonas charontis]
MASPEAHALAVVSLRERLRQRQAALVHRSSVLRERLAGHAQALAPLWDGAESARRAWRWVRAHPWVVGAATVALLLHRPRRAWAAMLLGWRAWRLWRRWGAPLARWAASGDARGRAT